MRDLVIAVCLLVVALIHLFPVIGVLGAAQLRKLYGQSFESPDLQLLMRHRAVMFGIVAGISVLGALVPAYRLVALVVGAVSVLSFLGLAAAIPGYGPGLRKVVIADIVALVALVIAAGLVAL